MRRSDGSTRRDDEVLTIGSEKGMKTLGIRPVKAIAENPRRSIDFYSGVLGLRLVKVTRLFEGPGASAFLGSHPMKRL